MVCEKACCQLSERNDTNEKLTELRGQEKHRKTTRHLSSFLHLPRSFCFHWSLLFVSLSVSQLAGLRSNYRTDYYETWWEDVTWVSEEPLNGGGSRRFFSPFS